MSPPPTSTSTTVIIIAAVHQTKLIFDDPYHPRIFLGSALYASLALSVAPERDVEKQSYYLYYTVQTLLGGYGIRPSVNIALITK